MNKRLLTSLIACGALGIAATLIGCDRKSAEKTGDSVQNAAETTGDAVKTGIDKAGSGVNTGINAANDAGRTAMDATKNATTQARSAVGQAAETSGEAIDKAGHAVNKWISPTTAPATAPSLDNTNSPGTTGDQHDQANGFERSQ